MNLQMKMFFFSIFNLVSFLGFAQTEIISNQKQYCDTSLYNSLYPIFLQSGINREKMLFERIDIDYSLLQKTPVILDIKNPENYLYAPIEVFVIDSINTIELFSISCSNENTIYQIVLIFKDKRLSDVKTFKIQIKRGTDWYYVGYFYYYQGEIVFQKVKRLNPSNLDHKFMPTDLETKKKTVWKTFNNGKLIKDS